MEWNREIIVLLFVAYISGLASQTIMPRRDCGINSATGKPYFDIYWSNGLASVNLIPFKTILSQFIGDNPIVDDAEVYSVSVLNLLANLLLFSPLGFFLPTLWCKFRNIKYIVGMGILISTGVEVIQLFVGRSCDIDDVILNTLGVVIGFVVYKFWGILRRKQ